MPIARVQLPDGRIARFEVPEGTAPEAVEAEALKMYQSQQPKPEQPAQEFEPTTAQKIGIHTQAVADTVRDMPRYWMDAARSVGMGGLDLALGAGQVASKFMGKEQGERYSDAMRWVEEGYQAGRESNAPDVGRFTGNVVAGGVLTGGTAPAATLGGRMVQGAKIGGTLGLVSPVDPDADSYALSKAVQVGGGIALGAAASPVVEGLVRGAGAVVNGLVNSIKGMKNTLTGAASRGTIEAQFQRAGIDLNRVPKDARDALINEVQKAIRSGGPMDDDSARRLGDFLALKIKPTQGQISRDVQQFAREQNYRGADFGRPLAERFNEQNRQLVGVVDDLRAGTGAKGPDPYAAGQNVIADLRTTDAATKGRVDAAYTQARSLAGLDSEVPAAPIADRLGKIIEEFGDDKIPGAVAKRLQEFGLMGGKQTKLLTVRETEKLKTLIGNNIENPNSAAGKALTLLKNGVDDAVNSIGDDAGAQAAGAFQQARGLAAQRFEALRRTPGLEKAISRDPGAPEKFLEAEVIRGDVKAVANLMMKLKPDARAEVRGAVLDWIRGKGVAGVTDTEQFNQAGFNKALQTIGERKLKLIFAGDKEALRHLETLGRVGAYIQRPPVGSAVNTSNTFTAGLDFFDQLTRLPGLSLLSGKVGDMARAAQAAGALNAVPVMPANAAISPALLDRLATQSGALSVPTTATGINAVMQKKSRNR